MIGIDLGGTSIKSAIFNMEFEKIHERSDPTEAIKGPDYVLNKIVKISQEMMLYEGKKVIDHNAKKGGSH
ncbi:hypothetical protein [Paenibacillus sp. JJ-100]|uniref:hypothetical protein n=1 Tax=Paenibacillus sp. JJ-100 TaxID=2974896 RepID=UPI00232CF0C9|nr:hypothetical protein [Paenibacillus sp. JJ-100]